MSWVVIGATEELIVTVPPPGPYKQEVLPEQVVEAVEAVIRAGASQEKAVPSTGSLDLQVEKVE